MKNKSKILTLSIALMTVLMMTMVTHYVVTQIPDEIASNIDAAGAMAEVNAFDARGFTPLMQAAIDSDFERTKMLLANGANPNIRSANSDLGFALNYAVLNVNGGGNNGLEIVKLLLENGADVNARDARGMAPIHFMMQITNADNRWQVMQALMARGAHINIQNEDGSTMLHITVTNWDNGWIDRLNIEYGQILNYNITDKKGRTPLALAIERGLVSENNAESVENSIKKRPILIGNDYNINTTDKDGRNGVELAVIRTDMKFVQELIEHGANLAHQDNKGNTALHYAVINLDPITYASYLLSKKAPVNIPNNAGQTPLFMVMQIHSKPLRIKVAQLLVDAGSPIVNKNYAGKTILQLATEAKDTALANLIIQKIQQQAKK